MDINPQESLPGRPIRLAYADGMRTTAIAAVVALHTSGIRVSNEPVIESFTWWTGHVIDTLCRWSVPVFIMLSGALMLDPERRQSLVSFYRRRSMRVVVPLLIFAPIYFYWAAHFRGEILTWKEMKQLIWQGLPQNPLYFLFIIIGLYVIVPFLRAMVRQSPYALLWLCTLVLFWPPVSGWLFWYVPMNAFTRFIPYIPFFLLGYLLRTRSGDKAIIWSTVVAFSASSAWIIFKTHLLVQEFGRNDARALALYDHFSLPVVTQSVAMFLFMRESFGDSTKARIGKLFGVLGPAAFGIYLVHQPVMDFVCGYTRPHTAYFPPLIILTEVIAIFTISSLLVFGWLKVPVLRLAIGGKK
jgi:surface polysaccharide O-acyltransferase-like enzyme